MNTHYSKVKSIRRVGRIEKTYNLQIEKNHNYFCNGVLLHNCDDAHNIKDTLSLTEKSLQEVSDWFDMVIQTRLNDQKTGFIVVIMQRSHHKDLTGHILAKELGYTHLCLPMEYEPNHPHKWGADPRAQDGELLWPEKFGRTEVDRLGKTMGMYGRAGQLQQRPAPREGGIIKRQWFQYIDQVPVNVERRLRWWDMAATEQKAGNDPDFTAGARVSMTEDGIAYVEHIVAERESSYAVEKIIKNTAQADGLDVDIWMEQEPGSAGKAVISTYSRKLSAQGGYKFRGEPSTGSKETYVDVLAGAMEAGNVFWVRGPWSERVEEQACGFPNADHDDEIEAVAKAYVKLATRVRPMARNVNEEDSADKVVANEVLMRALQYVNNTGGGADKNKFVVDHEPIGDKLWTELEKARLIALDGYGRVVLTPMGSNALHAATQAKPVVEQRTGLAGAQDEELDLEAMAERRAREIYGDAQVDNWNKERE